MKQLRAIAVCFVAAVLLTECAPATRFTWGGYEDSLYRFYKNPSEDGLFAYYSEVIQRLGGAPKLYFYHFPAQSGLSWRVDLIERLRAQSSGRIVGLKDSSGDMNYARAAASLSPDFRVFPSTVSGLTSVR